ncbi:MAG: hypothetical protein KGM43_17770 [Planctomycetota bacterium]|nr:hypothetical protein [Planctomycetota bacterium]
MIGKKVVIRRHPEWREHQLRWRWLLDSLEGGERYRQAIYGYDTRGLPIRNLIRHKREYPDPRDMIDTGIGFLGPIIEDSNAYPNSSREIGEGYHRDPAALASDDDYELRRARTPVPTFVAETLDTHLSRIYAREVKRGGPEDLVAWWRDVDGRGTTIDQWMIETLAPLLLLLGQIDVLMDHPAAPEGEDVETRADMLRLGLDRCIASCILPENMLWWRLDPHDRRYLECLVRENHQVDDRSKVYYRLWTADEWTLYNEEGEVVAAAAHPFRRVPIIRLFDGRKPRCRNIGQSRYESIAERQREYYNRDSELILSDTTQAHPLLQGPEDFVQADGTIPIGPSWLLPKKKNSQGGTVSYEGFDVVDFPKDAAESIRKNKADIRDDVDRDSALVKSTGREGVAQSGLSKMLDFSDGNNRLAKIAKVLAKAEVLLAELARWVCSDGAVDLNDNVEIVVVYPAEFDLYTAADVAAATGEFQKIVAAAGSLPKTEWQLLTRLVRLSLPGLGDAQYTECDEEIAQYLEARSQPALDR